MRAMRERSCFSPRRAMSMPSMVIFPESSSTSRNSVLIRLLLPAPAATRVHKFI